MASSNSINFLLFCSLLFPIISPSIAQTTSFRPKALLLRVTKDSSTLQYITNINQRTPLVPVKLTLDLGGQFLWVDCEQGYVSSTYKPARCRSAQCNLAQSKACGECYSGPKPGCNNDTCSLFPDNTITRTSTSGELAQDVISIQSTDGSNPGKVVSVPNLLFTCGATFLLEGLASGVKGMAGLGRTKIGLPSQFAAAFSLKRKFAICLSSSSTSNGVIFFGDSPYVFLPGIDVSDSLIYTPLFINPVSTAGSYFEGEKSAEYFIGVKSIKIGEKAVPVNTSLLSIDSNGIGGTKISTINPYTVLHTSIYNSVVNAFVNSLANVPRVAAVAPFGACFNSSNIGSTRVGPAVPAIDLVLQSNDVYWRIFGANSMVQVRDDVLCLGFVDGGVEPRTSIVIGGHQLEDNLLQFDLAYNRLGFSSSLLFRRTTCANFNFTRSYFEGEKSAEYFIGVKSITINEKVVTVNTSLLSIDSNGIGGTKISTVNPYTVLHASIYNSVVNAFVNSLANVPRVAAVAPFGACFNSNNIGSTPVGPAVPDIDLVLQSNDVYWRIFGANSKVQVRDDVLCLGFVDGGVEPRTSIVIGGHQLEDNLLQFDFAYNRLGFSSSLFFKQTTCSNFNFTSNNA